MVMVNIFNYPLLKSKLRSNVNTLFICSEHLYNFEHLLINLNEQLLDEGYKNHIVCIGILN